MLRGWALGAFEDTPQLFAAAKPRDNELEEEEEEEMSLEGVFETPQAGGEMPTGKMTCIEDPTLARSEDDEPRSSGDALVGECMECRTAGVFLEEDGSDGTYCIECWMAGDAQAAARNEPLIPAALPIEAHRERIVAQIRQQRVTCIEGETGCGKSSMVPVFLVDAGRESGERVRVLVTQPRVIAATSLARRVAHQVCMPLNPKPTPKPKPCILNPQPSILPDGGGGGAERGVQGGERRPCVQ